MAKKSNSNVFAIQITIALFILVFIVVMILSTKDKEKKEESAQKQTSALHIATPEALDVGFYVPVLNEELSHAENEELIEGL